MKKEIIKKTLALSTLFLTTTQAKDINFIEPEVKKKDFYIDYSIPVSTNLYSSINNQDLNKRYHHYKDVSLKQNEWMENLFEEGTIYKEYVVNMNYKIYDKDKSINNHNTYKMDTSIKFYLSDLGESKYDAINSQFYENIHDITSQLEMQPLYQEQFNYKNSYVALTTGIYQENEKYDFYNVENTYTEVSFGYKF